MPRAAIATDAFRAVADPTRRGILAYLALGERPVGAIVDEFDLAQPSISKHLGVLREAGLVEARRDGKQVLYRTNGAALKPIHEWTRQFEKLWQHQLRRIKERAERD